MWTITCAKFCAFLEPKSVSVPLPLLMMRVVHLTDFSCWHQYSSSVEWELFEETVTPMSDWGCWDRSLKKMRAISKRCKSAEVARCQYYRMFGPKCGPGGEGLLEQKDPSHVNLKQKKAWTLEATWCNYCHIMQNLMALSLNFHQLQNSF